MISNRDLMKSGMLNDVLVKMEVPTKKSTGGMGGDARGGAGVVGVFDVGSLTDLLSGKAEGKQSASKIKEMKVGDALVLFEELEADKMIEEKDKDVIKEAISAVEDSGIVFIDEIDKIISGGDYKGADASSEGVQRDLLPLIEGSVISTKVGNVNTDFILFICSGAFHAGKEERE